MNTMNTNSIENIYWMNDQSYWATLIIPHAPMVTRRLGVSKGRIYLSPEYRDWKRFLARVWGRVLGHVPPPARWEVQTVWYGTGQVACDLDNLMKPVIDALSSVLRVDDKAHQCVYVSGRYVDLLRADEGVFPREPGLWVGVVCHYDEPFSLEQARALFPSARLWEDEIPF